MGFLDFLNRKSAEPVPPTPPVAPESALNGNMVKVTDLDGTTITTSIYQSIDATDRVLVSEGGRTYHTHLSCFKRWTGDAQRNFTGWKIVKKSEVMEQGLTYCRFCAEDDNVTLDDLLSELDD